MLTRRQFFTKGLIGGFLGAVVSPVLFPSEIGEEIFGETRILVPNGGVLSGLRINGPVNIYQGEDSPLEINQCVITSNAEDAIEVHVEKSWAIS